MHLPRTSNSKPNLATRKRINSCHPSDLKSSLNHFHETAKLGFLDHKRQSENALKLKNSMKNDLKRTDDELFKSLLDQKKPKELNLKNITKTLTSVKKKNVVVSRKLLEKLFKAFAKSLKKQKLGSLKENLQNNTKNNSKKAKLVVNKDRLEGLRMTALKNLLNEKFNEGSSKGKKTESFDEQVITLFQKEMLFEQVLSILSEDEVDINALLFSAFEKIQSENYIPPTNNSLAENGYFVLEDKLKLPTPKWKKETRIRNELKINLSGIDLEDD